MAAAQVEPIARGQGVQDDAADHERAMAVDLPRIRLGAGAIHDRDGAAPDDLHDVIRADDPGRVLVHAEAQQGRVLGDEAEQPAKPVPLLEVLVDDDAGRTPRPAAICAIRCLGVAPDAPNAIMWLDIADAPAEVPATTAPWRNRSRMASASSVPPIVELSRS